MQTPVRLIGHTLELGAVAGDGDIARTRGTAQRLARVQADEQIVDHHGRAVAYGLGDDHVCVGRAADSHRERRCDGAGVEHRERLEDGRLPGWAGVDVGAACARLHRAEEAFTSDRHVRVSGGRSGGL